jgi:hypothetical protein
MSKREILDREPLSRPVIGWIKNHSSRNYWRVAKWMDLADLVQDGIMIAYKIEKRYGRPGIDIDEPHYMSLLKKSFHNHIADLLRRSRGDMAEIHFSDMENTLVGTGVILKGRSHNESVVDRLAKDNEPLMQDFWMMIQEMPAQLRAGVLLLMTDEGAEKLRSALRLRWDGTEETTEERLYRLTGFSERKDFDIELRSFLWEYGKGLI